MLKKISELIFGKNLVIYKLKKYLRQLYEGYPSYWYFGYENIDGELVFGIPTLLGDGIIKHHSTLNEYRLTVEGLRLVESWNAERLNLILLMFILFQILLTINLKFLF